MDFRKVQEVGEQRHPRKSETSIQYGTAGFRTKADVLDHVMFRMGALAALRSKLKNETVGVIITASHNPEEDNGVKLVDPKGEMLEQSWEEVATHLANVQDHLIPTTLNDIVTAKDIPLDRSGNVFIGRDTRASSEGLSKAVADGVEAAGGSFQDFGVVSTPQLHYLVVCKNSKGSYGHCSEEGYYQKLSAAFVKLRETCSSYGNYRPVLKFDGANGVGALKLKELLKSIHELDPSALSVEVFNDGRPDGTTGCSNLNKNCGADFVKVRQTFPKNLDSVESGIQCVSVDGDADRVVYFFRSEDGKFVLLDGDRIATLVAGYLKELVSSSGMDLNLGLVQTAYSNGNSTRYIAEQLHVPVVCTATGVKHLHHKALEFDIGVYFEANGHGTVIFSDKAEKEIRNRASKSEPHSLRLSLLLDVINQTVGDALSDMLLVESILCARGWSVDDWARAYKDLPNRQLKILVADRGVIKTEDAERKCASPPGLQAQVDKLVVRYKDGRSFVRPSGTEDVVRVYAEAETQEEADDLAFEVGLKVYELAGGVGEPTQRPSINRL